MDLWLTIMSFYHVVQELPKQHTPEEEKLFEIANTIFWDAVFSVLAKNRVDAYNVAAEWQTNMGSTWGNGKQIRDALESNFGEGAVNGQGMHTSNI